MVSVSCQQCGGLFEARKSDVKRGRGKFCGSRCFQENRKANPKPKAPNTVCYVCGAEFHRPPSKKQISKSGLQFCSRACKEAAQSIEGGVEEIQPGHYGTGRSSYRKKAFKHYPNECARCGWKQVVELLVVHHRDRDHGNVAVENLEILCHNCHHVEHYESGDGPYAVRT